MPPGPSEPGSRQRSFTVHGALLRDLRMRRGWTQAEAARHARMSDRSIRKAEKGGPLEVKSITRLAAVYGTPESPLNPETLLSDSGEITRETPRQSVEAMLRRWFDGLWNNLDLSVVDELIVPEFEFHAETGVVRNRQEMKDRVLKLHESFSNISFVIERVADLEDAALCHWHVSITHTGPWLDLMPTGKRVTVHGSSWVQLQEGRFGDAWDFWDPGALYVQLAEREAARTNANG